MKVIAVAIRVALFTLILTGIVYPLAMTGLAQVLFPAKAALDLAYYPSRTIVGDIKWVLRGIRAVCGSDHEMPVGPAQKTPRRRKRWLTTI